MSYNNAAPSLFSVCTGVKYVRGGEIFEMRDEDNVQLNDPFKWVEHDDCNANNDTDDNLWYDTVDA